MTLKIPFRYFLPVLDSPAKKPGSRRFVTRRPVSLAGKPLLAEKHIQVQPSLSLLSRKCYSTTAAALYRQEKQIARKARFKPGFDNPPGSPETFENLPSILFSMPRIISERPGLDLPASPAGSLHETELQIEFAICECVGKVASGAAPLIGQTITGCYDFPRPEATCKLLTTVGQSMNLIGLETFLESAKTLAQTPSFFCLAKSEPRRKFISRRPVLCANISFAEASLDFQNRPPRGHFTPVHFETTAFQTDDEPEYDLYRSQRPVAFSFRIRLPSELPGPDPEVHANFILESGIKFAAVCDHSLQPSLTRSSAIWSAADSDRQLFPCFEQNSSINDVNTWQSRVPDQIPVAAGMRGIMTVCSRPPAADIPNFSAAGKGLFRPDTPDYRLKLRLKLKRLHFSNVDTALAQIAPKPAMIPCLPPATRLNARFRAMQSKNPMPVSFEHQPVRVDALVDFRQKRSQFYLRASQHARYTLRTLRHIFTAATTAGEQQTARPAGKTVSKPVVIATLLPDLSPSEPQTRQFKPGIGRKISRVFAKEQSCFFEPSTSLAMMAVKPGFTDILHPERPRNISSAGKHTATLKSDTSQRRLKCLKQLRFRLQPVKTDCLILHDHPAAVIKCGNDPGPIISAAKRALQFQSNDLMAARMRYKSLRISHKVRLKRAKIRHRLPAQILVKLHLEMAIAGKEPPSSLRQKHFVHPSIWERRVKPFSCRLRLLPHPFGFPGFNFVSENFYCLQSRPGMTVPPVSIPRAEICGSYILKRDRVFLPPLSMKDPRRFLSIFTMPDQIRELFKLPQLAVTAKPTPPQVPVSFIFPWQNQAHGNAISLSRHMRMSSTPRLRTPAFNCFDRMPTRHCYQEQSEDCSYLDLPVIHRMLLRARRFTSKQRPSEYLEISIAKTRGYTPGIAFPVLKKPETRQARAGFSLFYQSIGQFLHRWPDVSISSEDLSGHFRMRLRSFRFPWHPESGREKFGREQYSSLPRSSLIENLGFADEIRAAAFFFPWIDQIKFSASFIHRCRQAEKPVQIGMPDSATAAKPCFQHRPWPLPRAIQLETGSFSQFFDPEKFFRFREKATATMRKIRQNVIFKHPLKSIRPANATCAYSEYGLKNLPAASMTLDTLHWIIMMRSFISPGNPQFAFFLEFQDPGERMTKYFPTGKALQKRADFILPEVILNAECMVWQNAKAMNMSFPEPDRCFACLPIGFAGRDNFSLPRLEERFSAIVDKVLYESKAYRNAMTDMNRQVFSMPLQPCETILDAASGPIITPAMNRSGGGIPFVPAAQIDLARAGFKHACLPDWIDTSHSRPSIDH